MTEISKLEGGKFTLHYVSEVKERMDVIQPGSFPAQMRWHEAQCMLNERVFILRTPEIIYHKFNPDFAEAFLEGGKPEDVLEQLWELLCELPKLPISVIETGQHARVL